MFKTINGFTKAKMIAFIQNGNNGKRSVIPLDHDGKVRCAYRGNDNNRCAVGCFIPDSLYSPKMETNSEGYTIGVGDLLNQFPEVEKYMPLDENGLMMLQQEHDSAGLDHDTRTRLIDWIEQNVFEGK